jgi:hypothetical protein
VRLDLRSPPVVGPTTSAPPSPGGAFLRGRIEQSRRPSCCGAAAVGVGRPSVMGRMDIGRQRQGDCAPLRQRVLEYMPPM